MHKSLEHVTIDSGFIYDPNEVREIRINTSEYRQWKASQNRKNLIRRTRLKAVKRAKRRYACENTDNAVPSTEENITKFEVPEVFSFINNPVGTTRFFEELTHFITAKENFGRRLFIDLAQIEILTIDALMYLLAIINNISRNIKNNFRFVGNIPNNPAIKELIKTSGFYKFVQYYGDEPLARDADNIQIVSSDKVVTNLAKQISDFSSAKGGLTRSACQFLYNMMIELMSNAHNHAYNEKDSILYPRWYCFAEHVGSENTIAFTFMDTGEGIPSTVNKRFYEQLDVLKLLGDDKYVISALKGELRSETRKYYRGKGLPKVFESCKKGQIKNMRIISNKADVTVSGESISSCELPVSLKGTLFYWQIDLSELAEVV